MSNQVQMLVSTAVGNGVVVPLYRACGYVKVTNADATNPIYVSLRNVNDGNAIANQTTAPTPATGGYVGTAAVPGFIVLAAGQSTEFDFTKAATSGSDGPGYVAEKVTHVLFYSAASCLVNIVGN